MNSLEKDIISRNRIVLDIDTNFFVEAGAGSGKTTMLVNRMVAMVEAGIDISKISAITFTRAAAGEFYERFQKLLIERSNPDYKWEDKGQAGQLPKPTDETRKNCLEALKNIDLCFMGTIDSFCNMILSEHPSEAGILSDSKLVTDVDTSVIYRQIYVKICNGEKGEKLKALANSFRAVNNHDEEVFCRGMRILMEHRNVRFEHDEKVKFDIDNDYADVRKELIKTVRCLIEHPEIINARTVDSAAAWKEIDDIYTGVRRKWSNNYNGVLRALRLLADIRVVPQALDLYGPLLSQFFEPGGKRGNWLECNVGKDKNILVLLETIQYNASVLFLNKCVSVIEQEMHDAGQLTYFDYLYYLRNMLKKDAEGEGRIIRYIYDRHSYFLIDEFQDTNPMQAEVFFYLASEKPTGRWDECVPRPGSLFIVGDPKQSIYRFRNADVTSFLKVKRLFEDKVGATLELSRNFRSKSCLCEFFNSTFLQKLPEETINQSKFEEIPVPDAVSDEFQGIFNYSVGKVSDDPERIGKLIIKLVNNEHYLIRDKGKDTLRPIKYSDFMVITYSKKNIGDIMTYFDSNLIPSRVEGEVLFDSNEALHEIYRIYSAVVDEEDIIALYGALICEVIALTKEELLAYKSCGGRLSINSCFDYDNCENEDAKKVADKIKELKQIHDKARNMSPAALMSYIMEYYKILRVVSSKNLEVVYFAMELIRNAERAGVVVSLMDGKRYLNELISGQSDIERCLSLNDNEDRVHVANLHKVKGLEAPIVILALGQSGNIRPSVRIEYNDDSVEGYIFELPKEVKGSFFKTNRYDDNKKTEEKAAMEAENLRKVYVAATRARNALIICDYGGWRNVWKELSPSAQPDILSEIKHDPQTVEFYSGIVDSETLYSKADEECILKNRNLEGASYKVESPSKLSIVSKLSDEQSVESSDDADNDIHRFASVLGTMVHKYMEIVVSSRNNINIEETIHEIVSEYRTAKMAPYEEKITSAMKDVAQTIAQGGYTQTNGSPQDILKTLLNADEVYCEVPFCYKEDTPEGIVIWNGVMDVVYCSEGKWHILDYKTNADGNDLDTKYRNQLAAYVKAFKEITGNDADAMTYHIDV